MSFYTPFAFIKEEAAAGGLIPPTDSDALAYYNAVIGGGDTLTQTEINAVNQLCIDLKADSIFTGMVALYPMLGGTATSHKWNLIDPQDTDAAFRLTFNGSITHSSNGMLSGGTSSDYADTHCILYNEVSSLNNVIWGFYSRTDNTDNGCDMGTSDPEPAATALYGQFNGNYLINMGDGYKSSAVTNTSGFVTGGRVSSVTKIYRNGSEVLSSSTGVENSATTYGMALFGNRNGASSVADPAFRQQAFAFIYDGTPSQTDLNTAVTDFQTTLGRNV